MSTAYTDGVARDQDYLGQLAMRFRGTRDKAERRRIADEYAVAVERLISSGGWDEAPPPEDQLPDEVMTPRFFEYWSRRRAGP